MIFYRCVRWISAVLVLAPVALAREPSLSELMGMMQPALEVREALLKGDGRRALPLAQKAYELSKKAYGATHPTTLAALGNLATAQELSGHYAAAEKTLLTVLPLVEKTALPREPAASADKLDRMEAYMDRQTVINNRMGLYNNLANLYQTMGRLSEAEQHALKALEFMQQFPDANITAPLAALGAIYLDMGDYAAARKPYEEALAMMLLRVKNGVDEKRGFPYNNLGVLEDATGNPDKALAHFREALAIRRKALKDQPNFELALSWTNLGKHLLERGSADQQEALQALETGYAMSVKADGASHPETLRKAVPLIRARLIFGQTEQADELLQSTRRAAHKPGNDANHALVEEVDWITLCAAIETNAADAPDQLHRMLERHRVATGEMMSFSSETRRIGWNRDRNPIGLLVRHGDPLMIAECLLLTKGPVQESVLAERAARQRASAAGKGASVQELQTAEAELHALREASSMEAAASTREDRSARRIELEEQVTRLRSRIGISTADLLRALAVTPEQVGKALPEGSALADFFLAEPWRADYSGRRRYGAVVYTAAEPRVRWIDLGAEAEIDPLIADYRAAVLAQEDARVASSGQAVLAKLITPLRQAAPGVRKWYFCPDGELQAVPFAALQESDKTFLAEGTTITLLPSARVLTRPAPARANVAGSILLVGDVDFEANVSVVKPKTVTPAIARAYAAAGLSFPALPGTGEEIRLLQTAAAQAGWKTAVVRGSAATESAIAKAAPGCAVVHLATHGGILPVRKDRSLPLELPFYSSFIATAGAQVTLDKLKHLDVAKAPPRLDGILTAASAAALPLADALLVTLSACETGLGTVEKGEGVLGIARALHSAGARHCVSTLWPVEDVATAEFMQEFYGRVLQGTSPPSALQQTQAACLRKWSAAHGPARAAYLAGGFVISSLEIDR